VSQSKRSDVGAGGGENRAKYFFCLLACLPAGLPTQRCCQTPPPSSPNGMINQTSELGSPRQKSKQNQHQHPPSATPTPHVTTRDHTPETSRRRRSTNCKSLPRCHAAHAARYPAKPAWCANHRSLAEPAFCHQYCTQSSPADSALRSRANVNILNAYQRRPARFFDQVVLDPP
jgi:hypothetical protein